jgi:predicted nucleic acid-binding protein
MYLSHTGEIFDRRLEHELGMRRLHILLNLPIRIVDSRVQYSRDSRAIELARQFQHRRAYDMQHLAVAEMELAELATLDRGLHAASEIGVPVSAIR